MISSRLLQAGIVVAAFFIMVTTFQAVVYTLLFFLVQVFSNHGLVPDGYMQTFVIYIVLFLASLLIVRKSADIAAWLGNKGQAGNDVKIRISYAKVFAIILVTYSIFQLLNKIPFIITSLVDSFGSKVNRNKGLSSLFDPEVRNDINWLQLILEMTIYILIIYAAKPIAQWFSRRFDGDEDEFSFEDKTPPEEPATNTTGEP